MKRLIISVSLIFQVLCSLPAYSNNPAETVIEDKEPYPLYQFSTIIIKDGKPSLVVNNRQQSSHINLADILKKINLPYQTISKSPAIFQTEWLSWHYDDESKKTLSRKKNSFFNFNVGDKYKFKISTSHNQQQSSIVFEDVIRQQQIDITPDTAMVWLKWKTVPVENKAVVAFMQRIQTEFEIASLKSNATITAAGQLQNTTNVSNLQPSSILALTAATTAAKKPYRSNTLSLNKSVAQTWSLLIKQLSENSVSLLKVNNDQHMINTDWIYKTLDNNKNINNVQRHQFQLLVVPGPTAHSSALFVYHTSYEEKSEKGNPSKSEWTEQVTQQAIAANFLASINLKP